VAGLFLTHRRDQLVVLTRRQWMKVIKALARWRWRA